MLISSKARFTLIFLACTAALVIALGLQHFDNQRPCPLCILQRYAFLFVALWALIGMCVNRFTRSLNGAIITSALAGLAVALRHLWVLEHPAGGCGLDPLQTFVNELPPANWLPEVFFSNGVCSTPYPPLLYLDLPMWSALGFGAIILLGLWGLRQKN